MSRNETIPPDFLPDHESESERAALWKYSPLNPDAETLPTSDEFPELAAPERAARQRDKERDEADRIRRLAMADNVLAKALDAAQRMEAIDDPDAQADALREARTEARKAEAALAPGVLDMYRRARADLLPDTPAPADETSADREQVRKVATAFRRELDAYTLPACGFAGEEAEAQPVEAPLLWWDCREQNDGAQREAWGGQCFLHVGGVAVLSGEGGVGKSTLAIQWGLAMARAGTPEANAETGAREPVKGGQSRYTKEADPGDWQDPTGVRGIGGGVVYATFEDRPARIGRTTKSVGRALQESACAPERFHVLDMRGRYLYGPAAEALRNATNAAPERGPEWFAFWEHVRSVQARLVVLDNAGYCFTSPGFHAVWVRQFIMALEEEAEAAGCGVLIIAHPAKHERQTGGVAGSGAWTDAARAALALRWPAKIGKRGKEKPEVENAGNGARVLETLKCNYGPAFRLILENAGGRALERSANGRFAEQESTQKGNGNAETQEVPPAF